MVSNLKPNKKSQDVSPQTQAWIENHGIIWFVWFLTLVISILFSGTDLIQGILPGNDDYLRLVQIRDWLSGQNWADLHQYRLNPIDPIWMHWSRFSDILIGLPIKALTPLLGQDTAELVVLIGYPSLILLFFFYFAAHLTKHITKNTMAVMAASFMAVLSYSVLTQFSAGRLDHHGLQMVVAALCLLCILRSAHMPRAAYFAGALCGLSLYIGIESAPYIAAACVSTALIWVFSESNAEQRLRGFGIAMAVTTLVLYGIGTPISAWLTPYCDSLSVVYTQLTLGVALVLWGVSFTSKSLQSPLSRLFALAIGAAIVLGGIVFLYPHCLEGPYANIDPKLRQVWLNNVAEAKPFHKTLFDDPATASSMIIIPIMACIGAWVYHVKTKRASTSLQASSLLRTPSPLLSLAPRSLLLFMGFCVFAGAVQTRLMMFATCFAIPFAAYLLIMAMEKCNTFEPAIKKQISRLLCLVLLSPVTAPVLLKLITPDTAQTMQGTTKQSAANPIRPDCLSQQNFRAMQKLGPHTALTQIDLGAPILSQTTKLGVTSAPYHRNTDGILAAINVFTGTSAQALTAIHAAKARYVIACTTSNETRLYTAINPDGMMSQLKNGDLPSWLETLDLGQGNNLLILEVKQDDETKSED